MIEELSAPNHMLAEMHPAKEPACPECGHSDRIGKVSTVVRQGSGLVYFLDATERAFLSDLARTLSRPDPPQKPAYLRAAFWIGCSYLVLALLLVVARLLIEYAGAAGAALDLARYGAITGLGLIAPALIAGTTYLNRQRYSEAYPAWQAACEQWRRLYYCERDDSIFFKDEAIPYAPEQMPAVIYATHQTRPVNPEMALEPAAKAGALEALKSNGESPVATAS